jgi:3-oxoacyl-[acyl-carrier-protein] synthase I
MYGESEAYISRIGMITPIGFNTKMSFGAFNAGIDGFRVSEFEDIDGDAIKMSLIPDDIIVSYPKDIDEGDYYSERFDHIIKMSTMAFKECVDGLSFKEPVPLFLGLAEPVDGVTDFPKKLLFNNLFDSTHYSIFEKDIKIYNSGRASGIQALNSAMNFLSQSSVNYVLIGGSDSYFNVPLLSKLSKEKRLLTETASSGFIPGEAAGFILLSRSPENAMVVDRHIIRVCLPGINKEQGHIYSTEPYKGDGLHKAFSMALNHSEEKSIDTVYSSFNGEPFWAKEFGVASIRNEKYLKESYSHKHPADCLGDLGAATSPVLIGLAAMDLLFNKLQTNALLYSSSDFGLRGAVVLKKIALP